DIETGKRLPRASRWEVYTATRISGCSGKVVVKVDNQNYYFLLGSWKDDVRVLALFYNFGVRLENSSSRNGFRLTLPQTRYEVPISGNEVFDHFEALV